MEIQKKLLSLWKCCGNGGEKILSRAGTFAWRGRVG